MQDASDLERKLRDSARFVKRRKVLVHRVQVCMDEDDGDSDTEDIINEEAVQAMQSDAANKTNRDYPSFREREAHMGT